jgi:hypothetical protein
MLSMYIKIYIDTCGTGHASACGVLEREQVGDSSPTSPTKRKSTSNRGHDRPTEAGALRALSYDLMWGGEG